MEPTGPRIAAVASSVVVTPSPSTCDGRRQDCAAGQRTPRRGLRAGDLENSVADLDLARLVGRPAGCQLNPSPPTALSKKCADTTAPLQRLLAETSPPGTPGGFRAARLARLSAAAADRNGSAAVA